MHPIGWSVRSRATWIGFALAGWVGGTALQLQQPALWADSAYAVLLGLALVVGAGMVASTGAGRATPHLARAGAIGIMLCAAACAFGMAGWRGASFQQAALAPSLEGIDLRLTGVVVAMPQRNDGGLRFRLRVEAVAPLADGTVPVLPALNELHWYRGPMTFETDTGPQAQGQGQPPDLRAGDRWQMTVRLKAPHGGRNPRGFDYELWLWEQGVQATGYVRAGPNDVAPKLLATTWSHPVERLRQAARDAVYARLVPASLQGPEAVTQARLAGVIAALVVGDQSAIDRADWDVFRATGVAHLMSISGLHITMFAWLAAAVLGWLWRHVDVLGWRGGLRWPAPRVALVGGIALATAYAVFSGWGVPSQRTVWMLATVGALRWRGQRWPWPLVWLLACAVVLAVDPWAMLQAGFWLSFVAVGVLFAADPGTHADETADAQRGGGSVDSAALARPDKPAEPRAGAPQAMPDLAARWRGLWRRAAGLLREQAIVTLALTPLSLLLFQQVSAVGLLANLVAIPWVTLVVTPLALFGLMAAPIWDIAALAIGWLGHGLRLLAGVPGATVSVAAAPVLVSAAGVLGGLVLCMRLPWGVRLLGVPLLLPVLLWQSARPAAGEFELLAADIGQGNAVLVRTATHTLVFDTGPRFGPDSDAGHLVLVPLLRSLHERVDMVVVSHRDSDHSGGAEAVLRMQPQARLLTSIEDAHPLGQVRPIEHCLAGQQWVWDGIDFEILHPLTHEEAPRQIDAHLRFDADANGGRDLDPAEPRGPAQGAARPAPARRVKPNAISCVLRISNGRHTALLAGDIEKAQEARLVADEPGRLRADVLLVPHHGSKTSSSAGFLDAVQPTFALVQAGYRNRFGHPAPPVLARYEERGIEVIDSAHCGAMTWSSAEPHALRCERDLQQRYWQHRVPPSANALTTAKK